LLVNKFLEDAMTELLKPALYRAEGTAAAPDHPALLGAVCECGYVFFPLQRYGCEKCGGLAIEPRALSGAGRLLASARVHLHAGTLIDDDDAAALAVGQRMVTTLAPVAGPDGAPRLDLRFAPEG
jgi:hypothetical protein